ncbi:MAG: MBL fold metallo-hydrolase [Spirochaetia bacterium]
MKITVLGSGTSHGVPMVRCSCEVCRSTDPKNKRYRASVFVETENMNILIDTTPELRLQLLQANVQEIDAVFYTHGHADHINGLDDLRPYCCHSEMPVYGNYETLKDIKERFSYIFKPTQLGGGKPRLELTPIIDSYFYLSNTKITPIPVKHGELDILGYRIGDFSYITDCSCIPETSMEMLKGTKILIIGALRYKPHSTHFSINQAREAAEKIAPEMTYFTHISHKLDHTRLTQELPNKIKPAFDGLTIEMNKGIYA